LPIADCRFAYTLCCLSKSAIGNDFFDHFAELKHARASVDPVRGEQSAAREALSGTRGVREQNLIGFGVETDAMRAGDMTGAG
jgi:hypothetical protein